MITVVALLAGVVILLALGLAAAVDVFRQTAAWSDRHGHAQHGWTATDDLQTTRLLQHPAVPSGARTSSALCSEE
jgi:hypothetical protein